MKPTRTDLRFALDPVAFATDALGLVPDPWQARVLRSASRRILLNCSRQTGKSTTVAILALHHALYRDDSLALVISPSLRQSGELFRKITGLFARLDVQPARVEDTRLSFALANGSRVVSLPSSEEKIRGFSKVSLLVEDESARVADELHVACRPMLAVSGGRMILLTTPAGCRGHFYEAWAHGGDSWEHYEIRATDCPRIDPQFLVEERAQLGERAFAQEYLCQFVASDDQVFGTDIVMRALSDDVRPLFPRGHYA